jgi:lactoylglutathione lyase
MNKVCVQTVYVSDLARAMDFYVQALGYEVEARYGSCIAQLRTTGVTLIIQELNPDQTMPDRPCTVLAFRTSNIEDSMRQVVAAGGELLHDAPQPCPVGVYIAFKDPSGVLHELLQFSNAWVPPAVKPTHATLTFAVKGLEFKSISAFQ